MALQDAKKGRTMGDPGESQEHGSCGEACRETLLAGFARFGIEATVTTEPPIVPPAYEPLDVRCPHGRLWYAEPTSEQIAAWVEAGVE